MDELQNKKDPVTGRKYFFFTMVMILLLSIVVGIQAGSIDVEAYKRQKGLEQSFSNKDLSGESAAKANQTTTPTEQQETSENTQQGGSETAETNTSETNVE